METLFYILIYFIPITGMFAWSFVAKIVHVRRVLFYYSLLSAFFISGSFIVETFCEGSLLKGLESCPMVPDIALTQVQFVFEIPPMLLFFLFPVIFIYCAVVEYLRFRAKRK